MRLQLATWPEVESRLEQSTAILIPLGSTEQHGPDGLIGTDALVAEGVAARAATQDDAMLVAPVLAYAPAQFNLSFPGTVSLRARTFAQVVEDVVDSLAAGGFDAFYFLNGHGANIAPVRCACHDLHQRRVLANPALPPLRFRLRSWWEFPETDALRRKLYGAGEGMHATPERDFHHPGSLRGGAFESRNGTVVAVAGRASARAGRRRPRRRPCPSRGVPGRARRIRLRPVERRARRCASCHRSPRARGRLPALCGGVEAMTISDGRVVFRSNRRRDSILRRRCRRIGERQDRTAPAGNGPTAETHPHPARRGCRARLGGTMSPSRRVGEANAGTVSGMSANTLFPPRFGPARSRDMMHISPA